MPHPAIAVNIRGLKSRAGFKAHPQFQPYVRPIVTINCPIINGNIFLDGATLLRGSVTAPTTTNRSPVPTTYTKKRITKQMCNKMVINKDTKIKIYDIRHHLRANANGGNWQVHFPLSTGFRLASQVVGRCAPHLH